MDLQAGECVNSAQSKALLTTQLHHLQQRALRVRPANHNLSVSPRPLLPSALVLHGVNDFSDEEWRAVVRGALDWDG